MIAVDEHIYYSCEDFFHEGNLLLPGYYIVLPLFEMEGPFSSKEIAKEALEMELKRKGGKEA